MGDCKVCKVRVTQKPSSRAHTQCGSNEILLSLEKTFGKMAYNNFVLNALIIRIFFSKKRVRVNFRNFHTVAHQPPFGRLAQSN